MADKKKIWTGRELEQGKPWIDFLEGDHSQHLISFDWFVYVITIIVLAIKPVTVAWFW